MEVKAGEQAQKVAELPKALLAIQWQGRGSELSAYGLTKSGIVFVGHLVRQELKQLQT